MQRNIVDLLAPKKATTVVQIFQGTQKQYLVAAKIFSKVTRENVIEQMPLCLTFGM
jgi:hypothetical protein